MVQCESIDDFLKSSRLTGQVYNTTFIRWTTHSPKGLSEKDLDLAAICDSMAKDFGEQAPEPVSCEIRDVADKVTTSAGDCCTPKQ